MAYGSVTGYVPAGADGVYDFQHADGRTMRLFGPPAESLKARIDASAALAPQPVAGPGGAPPIAEAELPPPPPAPAPVAPPPDPQAQANAIAAQSIQDAAQAQQANAQPAPYVMKYRNPDGSVVEEQEGTGQLRVYRPGSAGSKGGIRETTSSLTQQGGFDPSEEHIEAKEEQLWRERAAMEAGAAVAQENAAKEEGFFQEQQRQLEMRAAEAEAEQLAEAEKVAALESKYDALESNFRNAKVDPSRYSSSFAGVLGTLGAAIGAFASTASGSPNFAAQILQSKIAEDIKAQETALNVKRDARDNMLGVLNRELGSMDLAKKALEGIRLRQADTHFKTLAVQAKSKEDEAKHLANAAVVEGKYIDWREQYRLAAEGQITKAKNFVNQPGSAGRAAGHDLPTAADLKTAQDLRGEKAKQERAVPHATLDDVSKQAKALNQAARMEKLLATQQAGLHGEELDDPTKGPIDSLKFKNKDLITQETRRAAQAFQDARGKSDMDAVLATQDAIGSGSLASRKRAVESLRREMSQALKTSIAGVPPEQAQRIMKTLSPEAIEMLQREAEPPK